MKEKKQKNLHHQLHHLSALHRLHGHRPCTYSLSLLWAQRCAGTERMTCSCATVQWTGTLRRLHGWCPSWRLHPSASGASCKTGTNVQEGSNPQSCARLYRTATYGLCSSPPISCRMTGVTIWCTRLWRRERCPIGLSLLSGTCPAASILQNWSFSTTLTSAVTLTGDTRASLTRCASVSELCSRI